MVNDVDVVYSNEDALVKGRKVSDPSVIPPTRSAADIESAGYGHESAGSANADTVEAGFLKQLGNKS